MSTKISKIAISLLIVALIISNIFFIVRVYQVSQESGFGIIIGKVESNEEQEVEGVSYLRSDNITKKKDVSAILDALIFSEYVAEPPAVEKAPQAQLILALPSKEYGEVYMLNLWLGEDEVIIGIGSDNKVYRRSLDKNFVSIVKEQLAKADLPFKG